MSGLIEDDAFNAIDRAVNAAGSDGERRAILRAYAGQALAILARLFGHEEAAARAATLSRQHHEKSVRIPPNARRRT